jgi:adenine-specific DNA-methyltransferase
MVTPKVSDPNQSNIINPSGFLDQLDSIRTDAQKLLDKERQSTLGQFFTPPPIAKFMAGMFINYPFSINLVDPGAGVGTLSAAFIEKVVLAPSKPNKITLTAFEIDPILVKSLKVTLGACQKLCDKSHIEFQFQICQEDFIAISVEALNGKDSLFSVVQPDYNCAILNPPYKKINSNSRARLLLKSVGVETTNLYTAFLWLTMKLLVPGGQIVAIVPRSFCNGTYFRPFRYNLLHTLAINRIHIFESRDSAFKESDVLQENIIFYATKTDEPRQKITITSSNDPGDNNLTTREVEYNQLVHPDDPDVFIRIIPDELGQQISTQVTGLTTSLKDLGITVSTGRVVDFRARDLLREEPDKEIIPLIYPANLNKGLVVWPRPNIRKPSYLASASKVDSLVIPAQYYVLVKRFSSKEEKRRVYAAVYDPHKISVTRIGVENHLNYFHRRYGGLPVHLAKGLALYLNSTLVDQYFRQFSGHTQVNATDLRNLRYPTEAQILKLGKRVEDEFPDQNGIDKIITEELLLNDKNEDSDIQDPIQAKKRIKEALSILQMLNVPREQQNDRSALTLLALVNVRATTPWNEASEELIGITEMMDYFRKYYGINYAPNTRETVRRQTVHQFIQLGLVNANPDDPSRPINSPKTRYVIESKILELLRTFGTSEWEINLREYLHNAFSLGNLKVRERVMSLIPVTLPNGEKIMLSSGGQNELIKDVIENFCPRYTPGGKVIYIGDAGEKLNEIEFHYFEQIGIKIDKHGKMPDLVIVLPEKKWLILIEAVTSHGPINLKRHNELRALFEKGDYGLVFVTAFESRKAMHKYLNEIAWETEVWVSEAPSHLIHFNGERFLGPYVAK